MDVPGLDRFGAFANRRELNALRPALQPGEQVLHLLEATRGKRGLLAATDRRLLFATAGLLRRKALAWSYTDVIGLKVMKTVDDAALTLQLRSGDLVFEGCRKREAEAFVKAVRERSPGPDDPLDFTPAERRPKTEKQLRRERLDRMFRKGSMTKAEYERSVRALDSE
ncbi:MAG: PH domain-containing protein [Candidatus Thermoplasmatota archaeon]|jgi:hypothetical protein